MVGKNLAILLVAILLLSCSTQAALIKGTIYGPDLEPLPGIAKINTVPAQQMLARNGSYAFEVPPGTYIIEVAAVGNNTIKYHYDETLIVKDDGQYNLDIILLPGLDDALLPYPETQIEAQEVPIQRRDSMLLIWYGLILLIAAVLIGVLVIARQLLRKPERSPAVRPEVSEDKIADAVLELLKKNKRMTQKEIRKAVPYSEAKISLVITDLESQKKVRKIKKGRANIIVYEEGEPKANGLT